MLRGNPSTKQVFGNMIEKKSRECDCQESLGMIRKFFEIFQDSLKTSGILNDSKKEGKAKRRNYGGKPARARRRERRAEARRATTLSTSPPPFDTSALVIDDVGAYMGGVDAWFDMGGHIKQDEVKVVGQKFGNNKFTQAGQLQGDQLQGDRQLQGYQLQGDRQLQGDQLQGDRLECDRQSPRFV